MFTRIQFTYHSKALELADDTFFKKHDAQVMGRDVEDVICDYFLSISIVLYSAGVT